MSHFTEDAASPIVSTLLRQNLVPEYAEALSIIDKSEEQAKGDALWALTATGLGVASSCGILALSGVVAPIIVPIGAALGCLATAWNSRQTEIDRTRESEFLAQFPEIIDLIGAKANGENDAKVAAAYDQTFKAYRYGELEDVQRFIGGGKPEAIVTPPPAPTVAIPSPIAIPVAPAPVDRLDPAQMLRDIQAGAVAGPVAISGGYPAAPIGVSVVSPSALNNVIKYPFVMVVAGQGSGKSVTMAHLMTELSGHKALSTPKANDHKNAALANVYSLRFGFDAITRRGQYFGGIDDLIYEPIDLDDRLASGQTTGTVLDFIRSATTTANERNANGASSKDVPWRLFYDEAAVTYTTAFAHLAKKDEEFCRAPIELMLKYGLMNFRSSELQLFIGCQSETVDTIGMKGVSAARDEAWHLYPGRVAIEKARIYNQPAVAAYLERLINEGYAIALLEKQGVIFEVLQLPKLVELKKYDPIVDADDQPAPSIVPQVVPAFAPKEISQAEQMAQMLQSMIASGLIPNPQPEPENDYKAMFDQMRADQLAERNRADRKIAELQRQLENALLAQRQEEIENDDEYGAADNDEVQPEMGGVEFDPVAALEEALIGAKQEAELKGKSAESITLTARDFRRSWHVIKSEYGQKSKDGAEKTKALFEQYANSHPGQARLSVESEGTRNESWRLAITSPAIKSTTSKAKLIKKRV